MQSKNQYQKRVEFGQDIYDLCLQEYGSVEAIFLVLEDNPDVDLQTVLQAGQVLNFRVDMPVEVPRNEQMQHFRNEQTRVNCGDGESLDDNDNVANGIMTNQGNVLLSSPDSQPLILADQIVPILPDNAITNGNGNPILQAGAQLLVAMFGTQLLAANGVGIKGGSSGSLLAAIIPEKVLVAANGNTIFNSFGKTIKLK